ncbi:MAG: aminotransferase class V-fold PLP-dependent enzyme [Myxococcota bacterium]|nr:aminotransferase class V-fold PLP-dependent enzyme [Myxococcota bacterium]MDW8361776.1 aminotransferase class V-fold PLP-dependent enzyme [Myxococcales bacterium]
MNDDATDPWALDPGIDHLNHGSFGACPRPVLEAQRRWRDRIEADPMGFYVDVLPRAIEAARESAARFVGADPAGFAFVRNATSGVAAVLGSLALSADDELLITNHAYPACHYALEHAAERRGARVRVVEIAGSPRSPDEVVEPILAAANGRTRVALIDHVTSPTALVWPVERIVRALEARGIAVLVDGAHAPGMLPLSVGALGASYYTGNFHKWTCAPRGAAFLWARADRRDDLLPPVISHGWRATRDGGTRFRALFDWTGTDDPTPWLCVPDAVAFLESLRPGGIAQLQRDNHALLLRARRSLSVALQLDEPTVPESMLGSMASLPLPAVSAAHVDALRSLLVRLRFRVPLFEWPSAGRWRLRVSAQVYNRFEQYERLAGVLADWLAAREGRPTR